ncbi:MAG: hypothetical protein JWO74_2235 [Solirubrobacterales bacterium]|nr:hypothetical protein [Solirubrobacterales bacterium]
MKLPRIAAPRWDRARRRRVPRAGAPRTIVPVADAGAPDRPGEDEPFAARVDQARTRLRAAIPPVADRDQ